MHMRKRCIAVCLMIGILCGLFAGCGKKEDETTEIYIFAAKSLHGAVDQLIEAYEKDHEGVKIIASYDSSGTLMTQIKEGATCDLFFSAAQKQMNELLAEDLIVDGTVRNVLNNQVCLVTYRGSKTKVTGLRDLSKAKSMALAGGSVPVGKYTRTALVQAKMVETTKAPAELTTEEIAKTLGITINECANVGAVAASVAQGANEIGTVYYSDLFGYQNQLEVIEMIPLDLTGDVIYPLGQVKRKGADAEAVQEFYEYLIGVQAKHVYTYFQFKPMLP